MKKGRRIFIMANNVHQGGGRTLLISLLENFEKDTEVVVLLDSRINLGNITLQNIQLKYISPNILSRLKSELWLYRAAKKNDVIFCFGNLPPLFPASSYVSVFVQNRHLIEATNLSNFPFKSMLRIKVERIWLSLFSKNVERFIVQTPSMKSSLKKFLGSEIKIDVCPFSNNLRDCKQVSEATLSVEKKYDFSYIASGEPHKNHYKLIEAWELLANEGIFPTLCLTIDKIKFENLYKHINDKKNHSKIRIYNLGEVSTEEISDLYSVSSAMIFPSLLESFGLPLVEAAAHGIPILASELDYVRDLIDPIEVFNPDSALSISRSVKRFLKKDEARLGVLSSEEFALFLSNLQD